MLTTLHDYEGDKGQSYGGGIIRLWHEWSFTDKTWKTKGNWLKQHFEYFFLPPWLKYYDDDGNGRFSYGRQWKFVKMPTDGTFSFSSAQYKSTSNPEDWLVSLQTDNDTWLPYVIIPADGSVGSEDFKAYFVPFKNTGSGVGA